MLGDSQTAYTEQMKNWFRKRCSTMRSVKLLPVSSFHQSRSTTTILNKCQVNITPGPTLVKAEPSPLPSNPDLLSPTNVDGSGDRLK